MSTTLAAVGQLSVRPRRNWCAMAAALTLDDYARSLGEIERRWPSMLPGMPGIDDFHGYAGYSAVPRVRRMVAAMTPVERAAPALLGSARLAEIAAAAGVAAWEVERLVEGFGAWRAGMRRVESLSVWQLIRLVLGWGGVPADPYVAPDAGR